MSPLPIPNLFDHDHFLLQQGDVYAMEDICGIPASLRIVNGKITIGCQDSSYTMAEFLFNMEHIQKMIAGFNYPPFIIHGYIYGGDVFNLSKIYGPFERFVAYDVRTTNRWYSVPEAKSLCGKFKIDFVHFVKGPNTLNFAQEQASAASMQSYRNGQGPGLPRHGVILRHETVARDKFGNRMLTQLYSEKFIPYMVSVGAFPAM